MPTWTPCCVSVGSAAPFVPSAANEGERLFYWRYRVVGANPVVDQLVMRDVHAIPAVESTRTFIVVGNMHWRR